MKYRMAWHALLDRIGQILSTNLFPDNTAQVIDVGPPPKRTRPHRRAKVKADWHVVPTGARSRIDRRPQSRP